MADTPSPHSDNLTLENVPNNIIQRLIKMAIKAAGGSRSKAEQLLAEPNGEGSSLLERAMVEVVEKLSPTIESHHIIIDRTLDGLDDEAWEAEFADGNHYDWVYAEIRKLKAKLCPKKVQQDGPQSPHRVEPVGMTEEVKTVHYNRLMTTQQVLDDLEAQGLRPATLEELHAFGKAKPELQRQYPIAALSSRVPGSGGGVGVPILYGGVGERGLGLGWDGPRIQWGADYRFLALPKKSS